MSEETPPPPLRLKPRLPQPEEKAAGGQDQPAPSIKDSDALMPKAAATSAEPAQSEGAMKLRLKPKLTVDSPAESTEQPASVETPTVADAAPASEVKATPAPEPAAEKPPAPAPVPDVPSPEPASAESPKFKLKPKSASSAGKSAQAAKADESTDGVPPVLGETAGQAPLDPQVLADSAPPPPKGLAKPALSPAAMRRRKLVRLGIVLAVVLAIGAGGYFVRAKFAAKAAEEKTKREAYFTSAQVSLRSTEEAKTIEQPKAKELTPSETLNQLAALPAALINKGKDTVAARNNSEQSRVDAVLDGNDVPDERALDTPPPGQLLAKPADSTAATDVRVETQLAPGITVTTTDLVASAPVSSEFRNFVSEARINGVFQGTPPRALINGRTVRAGEKVDIQLGIVFDSVEPGKKSITFKDRTGATITRKY